MIEIFTGTVGSGKSYHALVRGLNKVNCIPERYVIANFPIKYKNKKERKRWIYTENDYLTVDYLIEQSFKLGLYGNEGKGLIIIDEAGVMFNSRDWQIAGNKRKEWIKFFSQSRKFGYDVIMIAQDMRMIDRQIRALAEFEVKHVKANNYGLFKILPITVFLYVTYWMAGRFKGKLNMGILFPWIANRYDTMKMFDMSPAVLELASRYGIDVAESRKEGKGFPLPASAASMSE